MNYLYVNNLITKKKKWRLMKQMIDIPEFTQAILIPKIITDNQVITSEKEIANAFGNFFSNITVLIPSFQNIDNFLSNPNFFPPDLSVLMNKNYCFAPEPKIQYTTVDEVLEIIKVLPNKASTGQDKISTAIIKFTKDYFVKVYVYLINAIFKTGIYPQKFKHANITLIFKKGDKLNIKNYRLILLLSNLDKVVEKIILI